MPAVITTAFSAVALLVSPITEAGPLSMGSVLPDYGIVSVGSSADLQLNSGPVNGKVLIGNGSTASMGGVHTTGGVDDSGAASVTGFPAGTVKPVEAIIGTTAFGDAGMLSSMAAALTPTQSFMNISGTQTITGGVGLNVIDVNALHNPTLTISGGPHSFFVFNVSDFYSANNPITLMNGVTPAHILWNFTGSTGIGGDVFRVDNASGTTHLFGTFLATDGGSFHVSGGNLTGELIDTGGTIRFASNSTLTAEPFVPPPPSSVPEPGSLLLLTTALGLLSGRRLWLRKSHPSGRL